MAYKRKRSTRAPVRRTRRRTMHMRKPKVSRAISQNSMFCTRSVILNPATFSSVAWLSINYTFNLSQLNNYTQFSGLFDRYRILGAKLTFTPYFNSDDASQVFSANWITLPRVYTIIDKDGEFQVGNENSALNNSNVRQIRDASKAFSIYVRHPAAQVLASTSVSFAAAVPKGAQWIDTTNNQVLHYGASLMGICPSGSGTGAFSYNVVLKLYLQFKNVV